MPVRAEKRALPRFPGNKKDLKGDFVLKRGFLRD
jgi:hypothetical protein